MSRASDALGMTVRTFRNERGMTQQQLANTVGRTQEWVSRVESGQREPRLADLDRLMSVLGFSLLPGSLSGSNSRPYGEPQAGEHQTQETAT